MMLIHHELTVGDSNEIFKGADGPQPPKQDEDQKEHAEPEPKLIALANAFLFMAASIYFQAGSLFVQKLLAFFVFFIRIHNLVFFVLLIL